MKNLAYKSYDETHNVILCVCMGSHTKELIQNFEAVQNMGACLVLNNYDRTRSVTGTKEKLDKVSFELRF